MNDLLKESLLDELFKAKKEKFEEVIVKSNAEYKEIVENNVKLLNEILNTIENTIKDDKIKEKIKIKIEEYELYSGNEINFWSKEYYKLGIANGINLRKEIERLEKKLIYNKLNDNIDENSFEYYYSESIMNFIECNRFKEWKDKKEYKELLEKIIEIKEKHPKVRYFIEDGATEELTKEELNAIYNYILLVEKIDNIEKVEIFKLAIKESNFL